jgi:hypothetical protein
VIIVLGGVEALASRPVFHRRHAIRMGRRPRPHGSKKDVSSIAVFDHIPRTGRRPCVRTGEGGYADKLWAMLGIASVRTKRAVARNHRQLTADLRSTQCQLQIQYEAP